MENFSACGKGLWINLWRLWKSASFQQLFRRIPILCTKKWGKTFVSDLVEGLEKSKWVGGVMRDTFRLIGLLGANFLSKFGQLGRILGASFYIAMETAGPLLVKLLLQGMGKLFMNLPGMIGKFGWGAAAGVAAGVVGGTWPPSILRAP